MIWMAGFRQRHAGLALVKMDIGASIVDAGQRYVDQVVLTT